LAPIRKILVSQVSRRKGWLHPSLFGINPLGESVVKSLGCAASWRFCEIHHATRNSRSRPSRSLQVFSRAISKLRASVS
jgi:hypothetical protein